MLLNALLIIQTIHACRIIKLTGSTVNAHINSLFVRVNEYKLEDKNRGNKNIYSAITQLCKRNYSYHCLLFITALLHFIDLYSVPQLLDI